jgi:ATP-dependent helicase HrpB
MGLAHVSDVAWLDTPAEAAVERAESLLDRLGARGERAQRLARYPLPPRLSRILVEAVERGVGEDGCVAVALLGSGVRVEKNDLLASMDVDLDHRVLQHVSQLRRIARIAGKKKHNDDALLMSVLAGFPDRVAKQRAGKQVLLSTGASAELAGEPPGYEFMVAVDAEDRKEKPLPLIRMTARIEPEWLIDLFPDHVKDRSEVVWNRVAERVDAVSALYYDGLVIQESRGAVPDAQAAAELLAQKAVEEGIERFVDVDSLNDFLGRVEFAGLAAPDIPQALRELCVGLRSFAELKKAAVDLVSVLEQKIGARRFRELAPESIRLQKGRQTKVHYERGKPPWIASRLQDFFGMHDTPRIGPAHTPVVVHLLAPNQRAVQTTTDLAGFWEGLYLEVRRELMRRYPRHAWPERP